MLRKALGHLLEDQSDLRQQVAEQGAICSLSQVSELSSTFHTHDTTSLKVCMQRACWYAW